MCRGSYRLQNRHWKFGFAGQLPVVCPGRFWLHVPQWYSVQCERVAGLVDRFKLRAEGGDECWVVGKW